MKEWGCGLLVAVFVLLACVANPWVIVWLLAALAVLVGAAFLSNLWDARPSAVAKRFYTQMQAEKYDEERKQQQLREQKRIDRLMEMPTAGSPHLIGYRILRQIRMVRVDDCDTDNEADLRLREEAEKAGARGIINMKIRPYPGGKFSAQGDAVVLE